MKDAFSVPRRYLGLSGDRGGMSWIAQLIWCMCSRWHHGGTAKQLETVQWPHSTPSIFWNEKITLWLFFSLLFLLCIFMPPMLGVTRHLVSMCCAGLCWQALAIRGHPSGMGTASRNVTITACAGQLPWRLARVATTFEVSVGLALAVL